MFVEVVIDTSVLIASIVGAPEKPRLIEAVVGRDLVAPGSVHWEIGNAFSAMLKRKRLSADEISLALESYEAIPIRYLDVDLLDALQIAAEFKIYAYDAYVIACALQQRAPLLTLDKAMTSIARQAGAGILEVGP